jgi:hypothetical protein
MKTSKSRALAVGAVLSVIVLPGCTLGASDTDSGDEAAGPFESDAGILADIVLAGGQRVRFVETLPGSVALSEVGSGDPNEAILKWARPGSLLDVYSMLLERGAAYDAGTVERLHDAQLRIDARAAEHAAIDASGARSTRAESIETADGNATESTGTVGRQSEALHIDEQGSHPVFTDEEFEAVYCNSEDGYDDEFCALRTTGASTGWTDDTSWIRSIVISTSRSGSATHNMRQYICTSRAPIFGTCLNYAWRTTHSQTIPRHNYGIFVSDFPFTAFTSSGFLLNMGQVADFK